MLTESCQKTLIKQFSLPQKLSKKCEFVYINPIQFSDKPSESITTSEHDISPVKEPRQSPERKKSSSEITTNFTKEGKENMTTQLIQKKSSMEESTSTQEKDPIGRILVQWSSFIKIKKKNYLDDYIHIKEIGKGAFGTVSKIKMKYGGMYRACKTVKMSAIASQESKRQKFISEIVIPMKTDHPNLNKLYEVF